MSEPESPDSPWIQAGRLTFLALYAVTVLAALAWAFSNVRQIDPQNRAVVLHFGALDRIQNAGWKTCCVPTRRCRRIAWPVSPRR